MYLRLELATRDDFEAVFRHFVDEFCADEPTMKSLRIFTPSGQRTRWGKFNRAGMRNYIQKCLAGGASVKAVDGSTG